MTRNLGDLRTADELFPDYTHALHVTGRTIGRERGLQPVPVELPDDPEAARSKAEAVARAMMRRALPSAKDFSVTWTDRSRFQITAAVRRAPGSNRYTGWGGMRYMRRFYLRPITPEQLDDAAAADFGAALHARGLL